MADRENEIFIFLPPIPFRAIFSPSRRASEFVIRVILEPSRHFCSKKNNRCLDLFKRFVIARYPSSIHDTLSKCWFFYPSFRSLNFLNRNFVVSYLESRARGKISSRACYSGSKILYSQPVNISLVFDYETSSERFFSFLDSVKPRNPRSPMT